jgi:hypothetical protein
MRFLVDFVPYFQKIIAAAHVPECYVNLLVLHCEVFINGACS